MSYYSKILKEDEEPVDVIKWHAVAYTKTALASLFWLILPFFLMFLLFRFKTIGLIIFIILLFFGLLAMVKLIVKCTYNQLIITTKRLILVKQNQLFDRQVYEIDLDNIQDIAFRYKGLWQAIFKYGAIKIQPYNSEKGLIAKNLPRPDKIRELILKVKSAGE